MSEGDTDNDSPLALALILSGVVVFLFLLILCTVCYTVRCFYPGNTNGPLWSSTYEGDQQFVRSGKQRGDWLVPGTNLPLPPPVERV
jgi:hypothetical protein